MKGKEMNVAWEPLLEFATEIFAKAGVCIEDAQIEADALVWANLRGVDSHGIMRIPWYIENIETRVMNQTPDIRIEVDTPAVSLIEADRALGPVVTVRVLNMMMEKAAKAGIGWAIIRNVTHQGALGYYTEMVAKRNMAGIVTVNGPPNMAPFGARVAGVQNTPIAIGVPARKHRSLNLDMATSIVAGGKIWNAIEKGISIPETWGIDKNGNPVTNPSDLASLLPVGGPKGSGLAMMFECLCSIMVGNPLLEPVLHGTDTEPASPPATEKKADVIGVRPQYVPKHRQNSIVAAINIGKFTDLEEYKDHVDLLIDGIKSLPKAKGVSEILVPGEVEEKTYDGRVINGIPIPQVTAENLKKLSDKFTVKLPRGL